MASAFVLGPVPGAEMAFSWRTDGSLHAAISLQWSAPSGAPGRRYWERSDERLLIRFDHELQQRVNREVAQHAVVTTAEALARAEMRLRDVELFATHQPMSWYGAFMDDVLGLADGVSCSSFEDYANVNSASLPASLHDARRAGRLPRGSRVLLFCPAAGYTYGAVAMRW
jgi:3-oxoacyl-[acyl-carrier-protein] synthase III